jgi:Tol biopolymer transport system component
MPLDNTPEKSGLYLAHGPGASLVRLGANPVVEVGGFSPDGSSLLATFDIDSRVEVFLIKAATRGMERLTDSPSDFICSHPVWHPGGKYILYSMNYTSEFTSGSTQLAGDELFLYSLDSRNARRMTSLQGNSIMTDFAPNGDFLLYCSTPGIPARQAGRFQVQHNIDQSTTNPGNPANPAGLETRRLYFVPWVPETFQTGNPATLQLDELQFLVTWTSTATNKIGFAWGPGGEWVHP